MRMLLISLLLLLSCNVLGQDRYVPSTGTLYLDEVVIRNKVYKNATLKVVVPLVPYIKSAGSQAPAGLVAGPTSPVPISFVNNSSATIYVSFTINDVAHSPGTFVVQNISADCTTPTTGLNASSFSISPGATCGVTVDPTNSTLAAALGSSRFCGSTTSAPADCMLAQTNHQTLLETTFQSYVSGVSCWNNASCVWYDISVIPQNCTDQLWSSDFCANTGGAAYNLPVQMSCDGQPTYSCASPGTSQYGSGYPSNCGNPQGTCATGSPGCSNGVSAYFYPMFDPPENAYQPNAVCPNGNTLEITFQAGS